MISKPFLFLIKLGCFADTHWFFSSIFLQFSLAKKNVGQNKCWSTSFGVVKKCWRKKNWGLTLFWLKKFGSEIVLGQKKCGSEFWTKFYFGLICYMICLCCGFLCLLLTLTTTTRSLTGGLMGGLHTDNRVKPTSTWLWLSWVLTILTVFKAT